MRIRARAVPWQYILAISSLVARAAFPETRCTTLRVVEPIGIPSVVGIIVIQNRYGILPVTGIATASLSRARDGLVVNVRWRLLAVFFTSIGRAALVSN